MQVVRLEVAMASLDSSAISFGRLVCAEGPWKVLLCGATCLERDEGPKWFDLVLQFLAISGSSVLLALGATNLLSRYVPFSHMFFNITFPALGSGQVSFLFDHLH